ncbi:DNA repair protein RecO [Psychrobacter glacincola]|uniref:DNA repair protein RecO n=1 Tax=Psychrobacter TaxID=497 RepID=UPI0018DF24B7|nr:DNA repair protein RecO C-terminal domain-containing protein [Psychrobacter aquimaris]
MRNEALVGYLLHQRPYQEKRALYYLFSQQHGVIHGIGKKGAPLFMPLQLFATGKRDLKTFSQINIASPHTTQTSMAKDESIATVLDALPYGNITGQHQYAALYLNEILWRLLSTEYPMPVLWLHYQDSLRQLRQPLSANELRLCLRQFEQHLFNELGFTLMMTHDSIENIIEPDGSYHFLPDVGLMLVLQNDTQTERLENAVGQCFFKGTDVIEMAQLGITDTTLNNWSKVHRHLIDHLLDYQPLQSRILWQQQQRYQ